LKTKSRKDPETFEVTTAPRNFYTKKLRPGRTDQVLFSGPGYNCIGDLYQQKSTVAGRGNEKNTWHKGGHDKNFVPARIVGGYKESVPKSAKQTYYMSKNLTPADIRPIYPYVPEGPGNKNPKRCRDPTDGSVVVGPPNFYTSRLKKGIVGRGTQFEWPPMEHVKGNDIEARKLLAL